MYDRKHKGEGVESTVNKVEKVYRGAVVGGAGADGVGSEIVLRFISLFTILTYCFKHSMLYPKHVFRNPV